jgi:competence protein ComEA
MNFQKIVADYFHFTKRERIAILFFIGLLILTLVYRVSLNFHMNPILKIDIQNIDLPTDTIMNNQMHDNITPIYETNTIAKPINPNSATYNDLTAIGFTKKQAAIIYNYRKKGGQFYYKEDIFKVYSIDSACFDKVGKYLELPNKSKIEENKNIRPTVKLKKEKKIVDLNDADSISLLSIYGIGPYLAHQIINYRNRLGGFISVAQMKEVQGMHTENYNELITNFIIESQPKRININSAEIKTLALHPYSNWQLAKLIVNYRNQHGAYHQLSDLNSIFGIDKVTLTKILPYLSIE